MTPVYSFPRLDGQFGPLYPVVDDIDLLKRLLALGVRTVQLRVKDPNHPDLDAMINEAVTFGRLCQAQVFINDHWEKALEAGAYGLHLGQDDLKTADLDAIARAGIRLGVSTRTAQELELALSLAPSYLAIGHIFPTPTKQMPTPPQGVAQLSKHLATVAGKIPTVAIGGIDLATAPEVWQTGVDAIAVVRAVTQSCDLAATLQAFSELLTEEARDERIVFHES
ncbi:thiamine phosphate synthase [Grimontia hollisae]|uniref:Thiamine-phosphate synthase n=2 Tax=Grimontia hollisae TaxID=673 RepID=D0I387_GRIHO|nr:thiamine phosphate synthase [Grimontia hollisae]AMG30657.1 thiamine phosphate synthase [Grimontia hollisae]EEY74129.1 thiamin-phosphate pyrophosphorylase [Grimontia hollisae CIP 101886]STO47720.1 Thiamine-phosphate synthase [Grimontia hollisae]STO58522.1 Thiamine-phosphate synthase [Grimontia hollisae]STQ74430.1 Thiamine-phosphate synthase [Grimontia hollisae]